MSIAIQPRSGSRLAAGLVIGIGIGLVAATMAGSTAVRLSDAQASGPEPSATSNAVVLPAPQTDDLPIDSEGRRAVNLFTSAATTVADLNLAESVDLQFDPPSLADLVPNLGVAVSAFGYTDDGPAFWRWGVTSTEPRAQPLPEGVHAGGFDTSGTYLAVSSHEAGVEVLKVGRAGELAPIALGVGSWTWDPTTKSTLVWTDAVKQTAEGEFVSSSVVHTASAPDFVPRTLIDLTTADLHNGRLADWGSWGYAISATRPILDPETGLVPDIPMVAMVATDGSLRGIVKGGFVDVLDDGTLYVGDVDPCGFVIGLTRVAPDLATSITVPNTELVQSSPATLAASDGRTATWATGVLTVTAPATESDAAVETQRISMPRGWWSASPVRWSNDGRFVFLASPKGLIVADTENGEAFPLPFDGTVTAVGVTR